MAAYQSSRQQPTLPGANGRMKLCENIFFGKDGIGDQPNAFPEVLPSDFVPTSEEVAALALVRIARENPEATLVCLGPLTNVAIALKIDPNFAFSKVFVMGGNYYGRQHNYERFGEKPFTFKGAQARSGIGNVESKSSAEFNFHGDPEAASIVLRKLASRIVVIPWEAFFIEGVKHEKKVDFNAHLQYDTKLASFLSTATSIGRAALAKNGRQFSYCDEIAVAAAIDLQRVARKLMHLRVNVELAGTHTRGQVVVDWVDVLWSNEDAEFVATQGKSIDRKLPPITFMVSYDVVVVDEWIKKAVKGDSGPW
ncbi:Inosine-uridine preferring nucleoside hydrolase [Ancylostoma duodenale]|uniref:Inosine-uridine preferring nucleoside hydrolase n=1 Tax=Ancylostoma duodenale TaxID=51022 RepID=A0A0C2GBT6_9BILA|nr:Inosine-uridine preferring nucleoside hydrolase [Ancylostoma duodenale]